MKHLKKVVMTFAFALALIGTLAFIGNNDVQAASGRRECATGHRFGSPTYVSVGATSHTIRRTCTRCGYVENTTSSHSYGSISYVRVSDSEHAGTRTCVYCGYVRRYNTESHTLNGVIYSQYNGSYHQSVSRCTKCDYAYTRTESHTFGNYINAGTTQHFKSCTKCGYRVYANHSGNTSYLANGSTSHIINTTCRYCAGTITSTEPHIFNGYINDGSNRHYRQCAKCGYREYAPHSGNTSIYAANVSYHQRVMNCVYCNISITTNESHSFVTNNGRTICSICGYIKR